MLKESTFSQKVKADLLRITVRNQAEIFAELAASFLCAGKPQFEIDAMPQYFVTSSSGIAERLVGQLREIGLDALAEKTIGTRSSRWQIYPLPVGDKDLSEMLRNSMTEASIDNVGSTMPLRRAALRGAFLSCGTLSDPQKAYQVEFTTRSRASADMITLYLHAENIEPSRIQRSGRQILYFKEGGAVADFLALIGAHNSLLRFENVRIDKDLRNSVNRIVNCDTANAKRQADACARQIHLIEELLAGDSTGRIPSELYEAGRVRIENPGMSIRDIGLLMTPPIGKSGMNHRLKKLEELADEAGITT